jgi:hypothetical protein
MFSQLRAFAFDGTKIKDKKTARVIKDNENTYRTEEE